MRKYAGTSTSGMMRNVMDVTVRHAQLDVKEDENVPTE